MNIYKMSDDCNNNRCCCPCPTFCPVPGPRGPIGPTGAFILGKQTACKNAVALTRVRMGIKPDVLS